MTSVTPSFYLILILTHALFRNLLLTTRSQTASWWASQAREPTRSGRSPGPARLSRHPGYTKQFTLYLPFHFSHLLIHSNGYYTKTLKPILSTLLTTPCLIRYAFLLLLFVPIKLFPRSLLHVTC